MKKILIVFTILAVMGLTGCNNPNLLNRFEASEPQNTDHNLSQSNESSGLLDSQGNLQGTVVEKKAKQIVVSPDIFAPLTDEEEIVGDGDLENESNFVTINFTADTIFTRYLVKGGIHIRNEPSAATDIFVNDTIQVAGTLNGRLMEATEILIVVQQN